MRNLLIILWLILIGVIAVPVCLDYMNGTPKDDVLSVIQRETETDDIRVTLEAVSYTHLDVYKRQAVDRSIEMTEEKKK